MATPEQFALELMAAAAGVTLMAGKAVTKGAQNIKTESRASVLRTAPVHHAGAARTITYDVKPAPTSVEAEIGYDREAGRQAAIGGLLEFGGGGDHSPPHSDLGRALDAEESRFISALDDVIAKLL